MVRNRCDWRLYEAEAEFPDYGNWFRLSIGKDNVWMFAGDDDPAKLPTMEKGVPQGSTAVATDRKTYVLNGGDEWVPLLAELGGRHGDFERSEHNEP